MPGGKPELREDHQWRISREEYKKLLSFVGYGNFPKANILVFGIEEGTAGYEIEANIIARVTTFGEFDERGNLISAINPPDWSSGYWEPLHGESKIRTYIEQRDGTAPSGENFVGGFFLPTIARMCLELEAPNANPYFWWTPFRKNDEAKKRINKFVSYELFRPRETGIQTALTDWRPLPRPNMRGWPNEYQPVNKRLYNRAFNTFRKAEDQFSNYLEDALFRRRLIKQIIVGFKTPVMISFGGIQIKQRLLNYILPDVSFSALPSKVSPQSPAVQAHTIVDGHPLNLFLLPFPDPTNHVWKNRPADQSAGEFMLDFFRDFTQETLHRYIF